MKPSGNSRGVEPTSTSTSRFTITTNKVSCTSTKIQQYYQLAWRNIMPIHIIQQFEKYRVEIKETDDSWTISVIEPSKHNPRLRDEKRINVAPQSVGILKKAIEKLERHLASQSTIPPRM